jgi:hypothetical protein
VIKGVLLAIHPSAAIVIDLMEESEMAQRYLVEYVPKDRKSGRDLQPRTMPSRQEVNAFSETDAISKFKTSLPYKLAQSSQEWEVLRVIPR